MQSSSKCLYGRLTRAQWIAGHLTCIAKAMPFKSVTRCAERPFRCHICKTPAPSIKNMQDHHESKHPGLPWEPEKCSDLHEIHGGTTQGVAVRGSVKFIHH